ncbi:MAG: carboxypeptidase regulatory-like domain-containing protein [Planctomycetes bacterium]|nr:carboxypeptidase regulatory-like domain-containing protein [Planctomycetota bacterium]
MFRINPPPEWAVLEISAKGCESLALSWEDLSEYRSSERELLEVELQTSMSVGLRLDRRSSFDGLGYMAELGGTGPPPSDEHYTKWRDQDSEVRFRSTTLIAKESCIWLNIGGQWIEKIALEDASGNYSYNVPNGATLSGSLLTPSGRPVQFVPVRIRSNRPWSLERQALTDGEGRFQFQMLQPNVEYSLASDSLAGSASLVIDELGWSVDVEMELSEEPILARVLDTNGNGLSKVPLKVDEMVRHGGGLVESVITPGGIYYRAGRKEWLYAVTGRDGLFHLNPELNRSGSRLWTVNSDVVRACSWELGLELEELASGLVVPLTGGLELSFVGRNGSSTQSKIEFELKPASELQIRHYPNSDSSGRASFYGLPCGEYELRLISKDGVRVDSNEGYQIFVGPDLTAKLEVVLEN